MELHEIQVFRMVADEGSFSRAAVKLGRTQPAVSLAVQRLEAELGEALIDRGTKALRLTDAGKLVHDFARRFGNLGSELTGALAELRDKGAGQLVIGANESTTLYLLRHIVQYRRKYPRVRVLVRRSLSSKIPDDIVGGELELGVISYDPRDERLATKEIYTDHLAFVVSPHHRLANRKSVMISELGMETFIAHIVLSPYREGVLREFERQNVPLNRDIEMPTIESIKKLVQMNEGVAFLPRMCVGPEIEQGVLREVEVSEFRIDRKINLVYPAKRSLSHAAKAFLALL